MTERRRPEPKTKTKRVQASFDEETLARIDALIPGMSAEWMKGKRAKRADVLRKLVLEGLTAEEERAAAKPPESTRQRRKKTGPKA